MSRHIATLVGLLLSCDEASHPCSKRASAVSRSSAGAPGQQCSFRPQVYSCPMADKVSVCSRGSRVQYYWRDCTGDHVGETVDKLMSIINENYALNDYQRANCQVAFEDRLNVARRGRLTPGDHVKTIQQDPTIDMFEIRWADLAVTPQDPVTGLYGKEVTLQMRLYYVEVGEPWVVGLHCHEKKILESDEATRSEQDDHIRKAASYHEACADRFWGVADLGPGAQA